MVLTDSDEQRRILAEWSRGDQPPADRPRTVPEMLESSRQCGAGRIAVRCAGEDLDYAALHRRSDNLAALLADRGVRPGSFVGLSTRRGIDMVVALVAIVKAGAAYFPIDPAYPLARKQFMLDDVAAPGCGGDGRGGRHHAGRFRGDRGDLARRSRGADRQWRDRTRPRRSRGFHIPTIRCIWCSRPVRPESPRGRWVLNVRWRPDWIGSCDIIRRGPRTSACRRHR